MALNQRRVKILDLIREDGHAKVQELSRIFNVTDVTIRQDLEALEKLGYIQREHGGAFLKDVGSFAKTGKVFNQNHIEEKREIARKAVSFIREGECIILDSGSTTTEIAKLLTQYKELTVITNALNIALDIGRKSRYHPHRDGRRVQSAYPFTDRKDGSRLTQRFPCQQIIPRHSRNISGHEPDLSKPQRPDGKIGHDKGCRRSHPGSRFFQNRDKRIRKFRVDNYGELLHHRQSYLEREY